MKEGDPYLTKEFDELRASQRRDLITIRELFPTWGETTIYLNAPAGVEATRLEAALRSVAEDMLDDHRDLLSKARAHGDYELVAQVARSYTATSWAEGSRTSVSPRVEAIRPEAVALVENDREKHRALRDAAILLLMAEQLV